MGKILGIDVNQQPNPGWESSRQILHSADFLEFMKIALVQVAMFGNSDSARIRAIEMLMQSGGNEVQTPLTDVPTDVLLIAKARANVWLQKTADDAISSNRREGDRSTDQPSSDVLF